MNDLITKNSTDLQQSFSFNGESMTVKQVADTLGVTDQAVRDAIKRLFPEIMADHGKTTYLNEIQVTAIKLQIQSGGKRNSKDNLGVKGVQTKLEKTLLIQQGYKLLLEEVEELTEENQQLKAEIEEQRPLVEFAESVQRSKDGDYIKTFAKTLNPPIGEKRLFAWLREQGILISGTREPRQEYVDRGYFQMKPSPWKDSYGNEHIDYTPLVTGKGQLYIEKKLREYNLRKSA